ncbi:MAG: hypothetical protein NTU77_01865 [Actinobacteria bacterium]|nr:hypothetical protein [Actinomycetota bacterium]
MDRIANPTSRQLSDALEVGLGFGVGVTAGAGTALWVGAGVG